jgi:S1-C subfamily serine protease
MSDIRSVLKSLVLLGTSTLITACASAQGTLHTSLEPQTFAFAVVASESIEPHIVARQLIERGYQVVIGARVENVDVRNVTPNTTLVAVCQYLGHTAGIAGTSSNVACALSDLATGEKIYSGTGKYMSATTEAADTRGAISAAFSKFPASGRSGSIAQMSSVPGLGRPSAGSGVPRASGQVPAMTGTGTGFYVDRRGYLLTNAHVIQPCATVKIRGRDGILEVVRVDQENDLAILTQNAPAFRAATFRDGRGLRPGDAVVAVGFPLSGLLASEANVTTGAVSALAGPGDDFRYLQITAPVQPGNSGGPLLDDSGNVVGVVTSKLDALYMARRTGDLPQNVNFAINASVARILMDAVGVHYSAATQGSPLAPADVGESAKAFTVLLECWR